MKLKTLLTFSFLVLSLYIHVFGQTSIKGKVLSYSTNSTLPNATITVVKAKDSVLQKSSLSLEDGSFLLKNLKFGEYILLVNFPEYPEHNQRFTLDARTQEIDFGKIYLGMRSLQLDEVKIKGQILQMKMKGDTLEYDPKAFLIRPNDKVENLLKQLPGVQVDKNGKVAAQQKIVKKVLIDGEEFFSSDPTLITKNLRADMVEKIQLFDKKSDQADFTGIEDGVRTKTINIKLKKESRNGVFGKLELGLGDQEYRQLRAMLNKFTEKSKYSVYGTHANTGVVDIDQEGVGRIGIPNTSQDFNFDSGKYDGKGLPTSTSGGLHYDTKFRRKKQTLNIDYNIGNVGVLGSKASDSQQNLPLGVINTLTKNDFHKTSKNNKIEVAYTMNIDSSTFLRVINEIGSKSFDEVTLQNSSSRANDDLKLNSESRKFDNSGDQLKLNTSLLLTKKLRKSRRSISWRFIELFSKYRTNGLLYSNVDYFNSSGTTDSTTVTDQYKFVNARHLSVDNNVTFSEPISKNISLITNYNLVINSSTTNKETFERAAKDEYSIINSDFSGSIQSHQTLNVVGAHLSFKSGIFLANLGSRISSIHYTQDVPGSQNNKNSFLRLLPQIKLRFDFSQYQGLQIDYHSRAIHPTSEQLLPVKVNTDPLNILVGNPLLRPTIENQIGSNFFLVKIISGQSLYTGANFSFFTDAIVSDISSSLTGLNTLSYANSIKKPTRMSVYASYNRKIKPLDVNLEVNLKSSRSLSFNYVNSQINQSNSIFNSAVVSLTKVNPKLYRVNIVGGPNYTVNEFSLQRNIKNSSKGVAISGYFSIFHGDYELNSDISYLYNGATQFLTSQSRTLWNVGITKTFFKEKQMSASLTVNDILNQNIDMKREALLNSFTQSNSASIRRYLMATISWDLNKFK